MRALTVFQLLIVRKDRRESRHDRIDNSVVACATAAVLTVVNAVYVVMNISNVVLYNVIVIAFVAVVENEFAGTHVSQCVWHVGVNDDDVEKLSYCRLVRLSIICIYSFINEELI